MSADRHIFYYKLPCVISHGSSSFLWPRGFSQNISELSKKKMMSHKSSQAAASFSQNLKLDQFAIIAYN